MKSFVVGVAAILTSALTAVAPSQGQVQETTAATATAESTRGALREHMATAVERGFAGVVLVVKDDAIFFHEAYGAASREDSVPNRVSTLFDVGSISKQFTHAAILKLEEQGRLKTSDPIVKHLDGVPEDKVLITIDQLLDHESGLVEYHDTQGDFERMDRVDAFRAIMSRDLRFDPGTQRAYSNAAYTLLAILVEKLSGTSFQHFVRDELLTPANMTQTAWIGDPRWSEDAVAVGYGRETFGLRNSPASWPGPTWALLGNGGMVSNCAELHAWIQALRGGQVLSEASVRKMYGLDSGVDEFIAYSGANNFGFVSAVLEFVSRPDYIIVTGNVDERTNAQRELYTLARIAFGLDLRSAREDRSPPANGWGLPDSPTGRGCVAFLNAIRAGTEVAAREFIAALHPDWLERRSEEELLETLLVLQEDLAVPELEDARRKGPGRAEFVVRSQRSGQRFRISLSVDPVAPHRIVGLDVRPEG